MKVARKLTLASVSSIVLVLAVSTVLRVQREHTLFENDIASDTRTLGRALGHAVEQSWGTRGQEEALELIEYASHQETHLKIRWVWPRPDADEAHRPVASVDALAALGDGEAVVLAPTGGRDSIYTYSPVRIPGVGLGAIEIAESLGAEHDYLERSIAHASVTALILVFASALLTWVFGVSIIGRPMRYLVEHARAIGAGDLGRRLSIRRDDEIGELAAEMDAMSASLRDAYQKLRQESASKVSAIEQLRRADRLATVGTLASGIAHELGTPINVVDGHAQLISEDASASEEIKSNAAVIDRQCKRMAQIIRQLLDFARGGPRGGACDVGTLVNETMGMLTPYMRKHQVEVTFGPLETGPRAAVNYHQLQQVLTNIVMNAIDAMPSGGRLTVRVGRSNAVLRGGDAVAGEYVTLAIEDTGSGMTPDTLTRVFEPFFTTKDVGEGTGLGLSVAYGIVDAHEGFIDVASEPGKGTTFTVYLPLEEADA